jgi:hypothetical protein
MRRALPLILVVALAGCGEREASPEEQVRETLTALADGTAKKDYQRLCDEVFSKDLLDGITRIGLPCEVAMRNAIGNVENPRMTIGRITIDGKKAKAEIRTSAQGEAPSRDVVELVETTEGWRVSSLGAAEQPGAPAPREP